MNININNIDINNINMNSVNIIVAFRGLGVTVGCLLRVEGGKGCAACGALNKDP